MVSSNCIQIRTPTLSQTSASCNPTYFRKRYHRLPRCSSQTLDLSLLFPLYNLKCRYAPTSVHCFHFSTLAQSHATFCLNSLCLSLSPAPPRALPPPIQSKSKSGCGAPYLKSTVVSYLKIKFKIPGLYWDVQGLISMIWKLPISLTPVCLWSRLTTLPSWTHQAYFIFQPSTSSLKATSPERPSTLIIPGSPLSLSIVLSCCIFKWYAINIGSHLIYIVFNCPPQKACRLKDSGNFVLFIADIHTSNSINVH